ncbi:MAG: hypothetical protein WC221_04225 [Candidatus Riflebacteria bacterium]
MKNRLCAGFFGFLFLSYSVMLNAGAYDQLLTISGGSAPSVPEPTYKPVSDSNNDNNQTPYYGPFNIFKPESPYEREQRLKREAVRREQRNKQRKARAAKRARDAQRRRWAREDREYEREQAELEKKRRSNKHLNKFVPPPPVQRAVLPSLKPPVTNVKKGNEAKAFAENKFRIATLLRKSSLTDKEKKILKDLYEAQIKLFKQALLNETLTVKERALIKLDLPVINAEFSGIQKDFMNELKNYIKDNTAQDKNTVDFIKLYNYDKMQQLGEYALTEAFENVGLDDAFENMVGALKISAAIEKEDIPLAGKETLDFLVGRLKSPQAGFAVEGGRMYSKVVFKAMDDFMVKAMGATGKKFDTKEFWKDLRNEMNVAQKVVMEFVGGPNEK